MSFGEDLRRERELRQISLREIARATKIDLRRLEALERNDFSDLPGGLYNRGFVRAYCDHIGVDSEAMVNAYLLEVRIQESSQADSPAGSGLLRGARAARGRPVAEPAPVAAAGTRARSRLGLWTALCIALLAVAALFVWWTVLREGGPGPAERGATSGSAAGPEGG